MLLRSISRRLQLIGDIPSYVPHYPTMFIQSSLMTSARATYLSCVHSPTTVCDLCAVVPLYPLARGMYIMLRPDCIYYPSSSMRSKIIDMFLLRALLRQIIHGSSPVVLLPGQICVVPRHWSCVMCELRASRVIITCHPFSPIAH